MTAKEELDALIECRNALEQGDEADRQMAERVNDRIHEANTAGGRPLGR